MHYHHFKPFERNELAILLKAGHSQKETAELLGRTASAVCQELKRNPANTTIGYVSIPRNAELLFGKLFGKVFNRI